METVNMEDIKKPKIQVNEIFTSIQGEGKYTGYPSVFIRLVGCNLRCVFAGGSICDSAYTSHRPEPANYHNVTEVLTEIKRQLQELDIDLNNKYTIPKHFVITGGEPMRQQPGIVDLLVEIENWLTGEYNINRSDIKFTIETNGTYKINTQVFPKPFVDLFSISPKLSTSEYFDMVEDNPEKRIPLKAQERHKRERINYPAVYSYFLYGEDVQLKFVYSNKSNITEIEEWLKGLINYIDNFEEQTGRHMSKEDIEEWVYSKVMIMPEGETIDQITQKSQELAELCILKGWKFTDRLHIRIWGDKRAV